MDLGQIATVEVTSEDPNFPIESVFSANGGFQWVPPHFILSLLPFLFSGLWRSIAPPPTGRGGDAKLYLLATTLGICPAQVRAKCHC
jgi:hypothetical protein